MVSKALPFTHTTAASLASLPVDGVRELMSLIPHFSSCLHMATFLTSVPSAHSLNTSCWGDFNAHDSTWLTSQTDDAWGALVIDQLGDMATLDTPTRFPFNTSAQPTSPDISFSTLNLALRTDWQVSRGFSSDHLPIVLTVQLRTSVGSKARPTHLNYKKAD